MGVSLDGFIAGPGDAIDWSVPGEELHRFHNEQAREVGLHLYGRKLYELMRFWDTLEPPEADVMLEFAEIYRATPKLVFSTTLSEVEGNATLASGDPVEEVTRLKQEPGADLAVGGAGLAAPLVAAGLVDEYRLFVSPVVLGAGTPFFPPLDERIELELLETRTFENRAVYLRYGAL
jgi:dihydrofolate reductase